jgi:hypothetical protein
VEENVYLTFPSLQDDAKLRYWVYNNVYDEDVAAFIDHVAGEDMVALDGNVVIGKVNSMDQETGEYTLSVNYWVVNPDNIACAEIICDTPEYAEIVYADFLDGAVYMEAQAQEDLRGDMTSHNSYLDEEYGLLLSYPTVFSPDGEKDENGNMIFPSLQDDGKILYWVTPNTYGETPADFMDRVAVEDMQELPGNVVIGNTISEESLCVYYWVVDIDFIVNVEIHCDTSVSAEMMYSDLQSGAVYLEAAMG